MEPLSSSTRPFTCAGPPPWFRTVRVASSVSESHEACLEHVYPRYDQQIELATRHGKLRGAGSDAHTLAELGNAFVDVAWHPNRADALRAALASASLGGREASRLVHLASTWAKVRKKLPGAR